MEQKLPPRQNWIHIGKDGVTGYLDCRSTPSSQTNTEGLSSPSNSGQSFLYIDKTDPSKSHGRIYLDATKASEENQNSLQDRHPKRG